MVVAGCVRAVDEILQTKALPAFLLAAVATTSEGVVLPVGGVIWSPSRQEPQPAGTYLGENQRTDSLVRATAASNVAVLLRRCFGVLVCNTMMDFEHWQWLICWRGRDRLNAVSRSQGDWKT